MTTKTSSINSSFPCVLPEDELLTLTQEEFEKRLLDTFKKLNNDERTQATEKALEKIDLNDAENVSFIERLKTAEAIPKVSEDLQELAKQNKTLTENQDVTFKSTNSDLLDLFIELGRDISGPGLDMLLTEAWKADSLATLKIVWNARSIHLGKAEQDCFYQCLGWLSKNHPSTLLLNLQWLYRSVIELKAQKNKDAAVVVEKEDLVSDGFDILHGGSHGYFKDLVNILVLAANDELDVNGNPRGVLHKRNPHTTKRRCPFPPITEAKRSKKNPEVQLRDVDTCKKLAKDRKHKQESEYHDRAETNLKKPLYRYLHATVARLFAAQLKLDKERLDSGDKEKIAKITLAAKWAPSLEKFHDKHTLIASSIAEILYPASFFSANSDIQDRATYIKHAREAYRATYLTPLRKHLDIVERKITTQLFSEIDYARVPSLAMDSYKSLFVRKDYERFAAYIERVAQGTARISGAILTPATLIEQVLSAQLRSHYNGKRATDASTLLAQKQDAITTATADAQWKTLVQRIKDNGSLSSTMAVVDVSGSMYSPVFHDKTAPIHSAIGLGLVVAEVCSAPFGEAVIIFSQNPSIHTLNMGQSLSERVKALSKAAWGMNTDFVAVFERLILPLAVKHKVAKADMIKQLIVFSDMQFDQASIHRPGAAESWEGSYDRIKRLYAEAGYELPLLVFWNLAAGGRGIGGGGGVAAVATKAKPVTKNERGTMLVSGYSQGLLKMFLDNGGFEEGNKNENEKEGEEEELEEVVVGQDGVVTSVKAEKTVDPEAGMWRAIGHAAYAMLTVLD